MPAARHPPRHTALAALPALALDLETTGLDVANDRIVRIGAVAMHGPMVLGEPRIDTRVNYAPARRIKPGSGAEERT